MSNDDKNKGFWAGLDRLVTTAVILALLISLVDSFFIWSSKSKRRGAFFLFVVTYPIFYFGAGFILCYLLELFDANTFSDGQMWASAIIAAVSCAVMVSKQMQKEGRTKSTGQSPELKPVGDAKTDSDFERLPLVWKEGFKIDVAHQFMHMDNVAAARTAFAIGEDGAMELVRMVDTMQKRAEKPMTPDTIKKLASLWGAGSKNSVLESYMDMNNTDSAGLIFAIGREGALELARMADCVFN